MVRQLLTITSLVSLSMVCRADSKVINGPGLPLRPEPVEVRLSDGSRIYLTIADREFSLTSPYGVLQIKLTDVLKIEFGRRIPIALVPKIEAAAADLTVANRSEAWGVLSNAGEWAYPKLRELAAHSDRTIASNAARLLAKLRETVPADQLRRIERDVVYTETSRLIGRIDRTEFQATTPHFGALKLKIGDLSLMRLGESPEPEDVPVNVQPDPGYLSSFQNQLGQTFYFRVTGAMGGSVWGVDVYTTDSNLAAAAVHAGALRLGETGIVKVKILSGQIAYGGSSRNGVTTSAYGQYSGSYSVSRVGRAKDD